MLAPGYKGSLPSGAKHLWGNRALRVSSAFAPLRFELPFRLAVSSSLIQREKAVRDGRVVDWAGLGSGGVGRELCCFFLKASPGFSDLERKGSVASRGVCANQYHTH